MQVSPGVLLSVTIKNISQYILAKIQTIPTICSDFKTHQNRIVRKVEKTERNNTDY